MAIIVPIKELKDTNKFSSMCEKANEPIYVTKNGYGNMVVMNVEFYNKVFEKMVVKQKIIEGLSDIKRRKVSDGKKFMKELKEKYDI